MEQSENLEEMLKSPDKQPHFLRQRKNVLLKDIGTELFEVSVVSHSHNLSLPRKNEIVKS
jgi:hypothetical protein